MTDLQLYTELSTLPADLKKEVQDFIEFLKTKAKKQKASLKCMMTLMLLSKMLVQLNYS